MIGKMSLWQAILVDMGSLLVVTASSMWPAFQANRIWGDEMGDISVADVVRVGLDNSNGDVETGLQTGLTLSPLSSLPISS